MYISQRELNLPLLARFGTQSITTGLILVGLSFAVRQPTSLPFLLRTRRALNRHRHTKQVSELQCFLSAAHPDSPSDSGTMCEVHLEAR